MRVRHSRSGKAWEKARAIAVRVALLSMLWWILTEGESDAWFIGAATVVLAAVSALPGQPAEARRISMTGLFGFMFFFLARSLKGGMQVAAMALRPNMHLAPAMLEIALQLPQERQRIFLAASMSLLPGTLSAGLEGSRLRLHVLDRRRPVEQEVREVETRIARLFGEALQ